MEYIGQDELNLVVTSNIPCAAQRDEQSRDGGKKPQEPEKDQFLRHSRII